MVEFRLLGPVELRIDERSVDLGHPKQRGVVAALLIDAGRPVSVDTLIDRIWDHTPPNRARNVVHAHISRIRRIIATAAPEIAGAVSLERGPGGYQLSLDPILVDLHRFRRLIASARATGDADERRASLLHEAMSLWPGEALSGVPGNWAFRVRETLRQEWIDAVVQWGELQLLLGRPLEVIGKLRPLATDNILVEPLVAQLMRALYAAGRGAEALDCYSVLRERLEDDLGTEPGRQLQKLHRSILYGQPLPADSSPGTASKAAKRPGPAQLPPDTNGFTGRGGELSRLDALMDSRDRGGKAESVILATICGPPGVGKTALALHWAHRVRDQFGDGQLYVNLRGFDPSGSPMKPDEAVRGFLDALGVPSEQVPMGPPAQVGLYRSMVAGRRMLIVLDNARDAEQVRSLLPGSPTSMVIVTSRDQLTGLVAADGAHPLNLGVLGHDEAWELLAQRLHPDRLAAEPKATNEIIARASGLPLALAILAARAAINPTFPMSALAADLQDAHHHLDVFSGVDATTDVRAVFSWSYLALSTGAARMFRLLGLHTGPDIAGPAAASLAGAPVPQARKLLEELSRAHLVAEHAPGRYVLHDLLREYASEQVGTVETTTDRRHANRRLFDYYCYSAYTGALLLHSCRDPLYPPPDQPAAAEDFADADQAWRWYAVERPTLISAVERGAQEGFDVQAWQLAWSLATFLDRRTLWVEWAAVQQIGLEAAQRIGDRRGEAYSLRALAAAHIRLRRYDGGLLHLRRALDLFSHLGDRMGQAHINASLSWALGEQGQFEDALAHARRALALYETANYEAGRARALNLIGWCHASLGDYQESLDCCEEALELLAKLNDRPGLAAAWASLGLTYQRVSRNRHAISAYLRAIRLRRDLADPYGEAQTLAMLGDTHMSVHDPTSARRAWERALYLLDELGHPDAASVRAKLGWAEPTKAVPQVD